MKKDPESKNKPSLAGVVSKDVYDRYKNNGDKKKKVRNTVIIAVTISVIVVSVVVFALVARNIWEQDSDTQCDPAYSCIEGDEPEKSSSPQIEGVTITEEYFEVYNVPAGLKITSISKDSAYAELFMIDDIVYEANGKAILTVDDLFNAEKENDTLEEIEYKVFRNGKSTVITPDGKDEIKS